MALSIRTRRSKRATNYQLFLGSISNRFEVKSCNCEKPSRFSSFPFCPLDDAISFVELSVDIFKLSVYYTHLNNIYGVLKMYIYPKFGIHRNSKYRNISSESYDSPDQRSLQSVIVVNVTIKMTHSNESSYLLKWTCGCVVFKIKFFLYSWRTDLRSVLLFAYRFCWVPRTKRCVDPWLGCCSKWAGEQFSLNSFGTKPAQIDITCSFYALLNWKASSIMNLQSFFYRWTTMIRTILPLAIWMVLLGESNWVDFSQKHSISAFRPNDQ